MRKIFLFTFIFTLFTSIQASADPLLFENNKENKATQKEQIKNQKAPRFTQASIKNNFEYPAEMIVAFVMSCSQSMTKMMNGDPRQTFPVAQSMCSCIMDQFRGDFKKDDFIRGGRNLSVVMGPQYGEVCKSIFTSPKL